MEGRDEQSQQQQPPQQLSQQHQQHQQPQQQQAPAVIIVQQPVLVGSGAIVRGHPFLRRGVKLNNGTRIGTYCITCLGTLGSVFLMLGLIFTAVGISSFMGILLLISGGGMLAACIKFCHKAKQDYDALPQDHPDRITYSTPVFNPHRPFQLPPGSQIITSSDVRGGGHLVTNYPLSQFVDPGMTTHATSSPYPANIQFSQHVGPSPSTSPGFHVALDEDKPPTYEEVCKNDRNV